MSKTISEEIAIPKVYTVNRDTDRKFWKKVDIKSLDECWEWQGAKCRGLHGQVRRHKILLYAHRYAYTLLVGPIPLGMHCLHKCNNPPCVNPNHLYLGTDSDNTLDKYKDSPLKCFNAPPRFYKGEIWLIRKLVKDGYPQSIIGMMFKCCQMTISNYCRKTQMCREGYYV